LREDSPRGRASAGTIGAVTGGAVTGIPAIVVLLALGLILRLIIAYVLLPGSGFPNDLSAFQYWGNDIAKNGPIGFYARTGFIDYPPVYILLLGVVSLLMGGDMGEGVKLLPIVADLGLAAMVWLMASELGVSRRRALIVAAVVLINPVTWFNSAIWGQADAVGSIFLLLGLRELQKDHREAASALAVLATLTKLQLGILGFVVGFVVLRRSLAPREGEPEPMRILSSIGAGLATAAIICLPYTGLDFVGAAQRMATGPGFVTIVAGIVAGLGVFALGLRYVPFAEVASRTLASAALGIGTVVAVAGMAFEPIASHVLGSFGEYPFMTMNAYNPWALVPDGVNGLDRNLEWWVLHDSPWTDAGTGTSGLGNIIGPFPPAVVALALGVAALLVVMAVLAWNSGRGRNSTPDVPVTDVAPSIADGQNRPASVPPQGLRAEFSGLWSAFLVTGAVLAGVVIVGVSGRLYAAALGDGLLIAILLGVSIWAAWRDDSQSLLVALAILAIAFFVVPTRAHERYLFPFFGLGAVLMAVSWRWSLAYVILAATNAVNLLGVLVEYTDTSKNTGIPINDGQVAGTLIDWGHGILTARLFDGLIIWPVALCGVITGLAMIWALLQLRPRAVAALSREVANAAPTAPETPGWWSRFGFGDSFGPPRLAAAAALETSADGGAYAFDPDAEDEEWVEDGDYFEDEDPPLYVPGSVMRLWHRIARPSTHPDRSASLDSEPRGRVDKLDLWVVAALVFAILALRTYRLDEPMQMHFDEVYHARTATEFLQDFKYNIPHDIYEWTHPHLAKYAIAGGISLFSDDKVTATGDIGVTVKDVVVQPRTSVSPRVDPGLGDANANFDLRYGDRILVATGSDVRIYDLATRALVTTYPIPGAAVFSEIGTTGVVYVGTSTGRIYSIDTTNLDDVRLGISSTIQPAKELGVETGLVIAHVYSGSPPYLLAADAAGKIVSIDLSKSDATVAAQGMVPGIADFAYLGTGPSYLIRTPDSTPTASEADALASTLGLDISVVQSALSTPVTAGDPHLLAVGLLSPGQVTAVQSLVADGGAPDIQVESAAPQVIVAYQRGVGLLDARTLVITSTPVTTDAPATSIALNYSDLHGTAIRGDQSSYVAAGDGIVLVHIDTSTSNWAVIKDSYQPLNTMPGPVTALVLDRATRVVQALGRTPDGTGWTVYAIETNGDAVFSDAQLPFQPVAIGLDSTPTMPDTDREAILAFSPNGSMASVDVGQFAFSWRIVGVLFGALMAACLYLLVRLLFRRRTIALLVALFSLTDGMLFVQSRIAMNDTYVGGFLLLAYLVFAVMWLNVWKSRFAFWLGMPVLGLLLGLGLASKWVAMYAIASIGILILIRSALGRVITILGLAAGTGILGWMAIAEMVSAPDTGSPVAVIGLIGLALLVLLGGLIWASSMRTTPDKALITVVAVVAAAGLFGAALTLSPNSIQSGAPNYTFFIIMLVVTAAAAAANAYHPVAWTRQELWFAVGAPVILGVLGGLGGALLGSRLLLEVGLAGIAGGPAIAAAFWFAGKLGFGPMASAPGPNDPSRYAEPAAPAPTGWLRLGSGFGLPAVWMAVCVLVLPIAVYVSFYAVWAMPWQPQTAATTASYGGNLPVLYCPDADQNGYCVNGDGWPNGHTGKTLIQQTIDMYNYHNDLRASHPASSPWWAWPMDLKPVWFENANYSGDVATMIYDGGNPAIWWLAIFAMGFICWQAFKRRSLGLTLIAVAFFWQWLSWSRIDRAAFQYHFYTALPFFLAALAYFMAELWHGPSRRTWLLARFAAAAALIFPAALWLFKDPLCNLARVSASNNGFKDAICGSGTGDVRIEERVLLIGIVLVVALVALALILWRLERRQNEGQEDSFWIAQLVVPVGIAGVLLWWLGQNGPTDLVFEAALPSDGIVLLLLPVLAILAFIVFTARNPRRFVLGACAFVVVTFLALYPNLSAMPMPANIISVYNGLLPTWFYGFEFAVNLQPAQHHSPISWSSISVALVALLVAGFFAWAAWERRIVVGLRRSGRLGSGKGGSAAAGHAVDGVAPRGSRKDKPNS
jgi:hypothetical protein